MANPYNNYPFPATYQPVYPQYQQQLQYQQPQVQQPQVQQQTQQQMMTPPTIHAEIVQVANRQEALNFPVGAGQAQMMMEKDDSAIYVKTAFANGQSNLVEYYRKMPEPETPQKDYVTREEFEQRLSELAKPQKQQQRQERKPKENERNV